MSKTARLEGLIGLLLASTALAAGACSSGGANSGAPPGPHDDASVQGDGATQGDGGTTKPTALLGPSHGSMIAISDDDTRVVVANKDVGTATVFSVDYSAALPVLTNLGEIPIGAEPAGVVIHPNGDTAFVLARKDQKLVRIDGLKSTPMKGAEVALGSEPTSLALTPTGAAVWVANWVDGTLMEVVTDSMKLGATVDLNETIAASGLLGTNLAPRPSLAHPRALAITNNGDLIDADETIYVTDFYAIQKAPIAPDGSNADTNRAGVLYKIPLGTKKATTIELPAMPDMGYHDKDDKVAGCFPNQIGQVAIQGGFGYVISICASPKAPVGGLFTGPAAATCTTDTTCPGAGVGSCAAGKCKTNCTMDAECGANGGKCTANVCNTNPANVKTVAASIVSIVDLGGNKTIATVNLSKEFDKHYDKLGRPDDATRRMPWLPSDVGFVPGTVTAYFAAEGTDAVFKVDFNATYDSSTIDGVGDPKNVFITLSPAGVDPSHIGKLPVGIAVGRKTHDAMNRFAFTANEVTRNVSVIDLANQEVAGLSAGTPVTAPATAMPAAGTDADNLTGRWMFITGLGRWSWKGQGWMSCVGCHADGLSDNVSWQSGRGWRQSPTLEATLHTDGTYRVNMWEGNVDEPTDHEGAIRSFAGGVGAIVKDPALDNLSRLDVPNQTGLNGSSWAVADPKNPGGFPTASALDDWQKIATWMKLVRSPKKPSNLDATKVAAGKALFAQANCQGCHSGPTWTISRVFYAPDTTGTTNNKLPTTSWASAATAAGFPAALMPATTPAMQMMRYGGTNKSAFDQLTCVIRPVGTFGVAEPEVGVVELRSDGVTVAQGNEADGKGFNVPSLLGMSTGAPYFHAGQVRTLEALLGEAFAGHFRALAPGFLDANDPMRADKVAALVQFILSIDDDTAPIATPPLGPTGGVLCATQ